MTNCLFERNQAGHGGGVFNVNSNPTLTNCTFRYNWAVSGSGGGLYNQNSGNATITSCVFLNNTASSGGGAMRNIGSTVSITGCTFQSNTAPYGGGIQHEDTNLTLTNCLFRANTADQGGGIYNSTLSIRGFNTAFERNSARMTGGTISTSGSSTLTNCSFQSNSANVGNNGGVSWGAIIQSAATLINCVEFGNEHGRAFTANISASYSLFAPSSYTEVAISGPGNLTALVSPFVSTTSTELYPCSPAINAGDPATNSALVGNTDLASNARFFAGGRVDMGAYEFQGAGIPISFSVGCTALIATSATVVSDGTTASASTATPIACQGGRVTFTGSGGISYSWSGPQGLTRSGSAFTLADLQPDQSGTYTLVVTDVNSCTASTTVAITINSAPATPAIVRSAGGNLCGGSSVTLSVSPEANATYVWQRGMVTSEEETFTFFGSGTAIAATQGGIYRYIATSIQHPK